MESENGRKGEKRGERRAKPMTGGKRTPRHTDIERERGALADAVQAGTEKQAQEIA